MTTVVYSINCGGPPISAWCQRVQINYHSQVRANTNYSPVVSSVPPEVSSNLRNVADIFTICLSLVAIGLYVLKNWVVLKLLKKISETRGNEYLSIDAAKSVNAQYELVVSITVFCSLLKLCKLLR